MHFEIQNSPSYILHLTFVTFFYPFAVSNSEFNEGSSFSRSLVFCYQPFHLLIETFQFIPQQRYNKQQLTRMDFDGLDDVLQDNSYVPSFAPRETKKIDSFKSKPNFTQTQNKSIRKQSTDLNLNNSSNRSGGLFSLHKESAKKQVTTFQQFFNKQNQRNSSFEKNKSVSNLNLNIQKNLEPDPIFSAQRTNTRRPLSRDKIPQKQSQITGEKIEPEPSTVPRRGMMPPLNKKGQNQSSKKQFGQKMDTNNSFDLGENLASTKPVIGKYKDNQLDPLESLNKQQSQNMKKFLEQQIEYQKKAMEKIIEEERQSKKRQIENLKKLHGQQIKKKIELKDYEIQKLKQFYQMQINFKASSTNEKKQLSIANERIQENLKELKKIEVKINEQYETFNKKQMNDRSNQIQRKQAVVQKRQKQLKQLQRRLQQFQKQLKQEKVRINHEHDRQRNFIDESTFKLNKRQNDLQANYKRKERQLIDQYEKKRIQMDFEKQKMRFEALQFHQKKLKLDQQQKQLKRKIKNFEQRQKQMLQELHQQKTKQMQKQIEMTTKLSEISMKESEVEMERQQLINKMKILQLERKKLDIESKGSLKTAFPSSTSNTFDPNYFVGRNTEYKGKSPGSFDQYHKTITQMRDQLMKSMPKF